MALTRITSDGITDAAIVNADINASAAIAGTKISPNFGGQNILTTGQLQISGGLPTILLNDENNESDFEIRNENGNFKVRDIDNPQDRYVIASSGMIHTFTGTASFSSNLDVGAGLDVTGNITVSGTVDGIDIAALNTTVGTKLANIVEDTSPQLGGNLETNGNQIRVADADAIKFGSDQDMSVYHNGSAAFINCVTGDLHVRTSGSGDDLFLRAADDVRIQVQGTNDGIKVIGGGAVELYHNATKNFETTSTGVYITGSAELSNTLTIGGELNLTGGSAATRYIDAFVGEAGTFAIRGTNNADSSGHQVMLEMRRNAGVHLNYSGSTKFETVTGGATITGVCTATSFAGDGSNLTGISSVGGSTGVSFNDNVAITLGTGNDTFIRHIAGSHTEIDHVGSGDLVLETVNGGDDILLDSNDDIFLNHAGESMIVCRSDAQVELYFDNSKKLETVTGGVYVYGDLLFGVGTTGNLHGGDNDKVILGSGNDLQIYHDGSNSYIDENGTGNLRIRNVNGNGIELISGTGELNLKCNYNGSVDLYHDNSKKLETTSTGVTFNGTGAILVPSGTTAQRPSASNGQIRYNSTTNELEGYINDGWIKVKGSGLSESGGYANNTQATADDLHAYWDCDSTSTTRAGGDSGSATLYGVDSQSGQIGNSWHRGTSSSNGVLLTSMPTGNDFTLMFWLMLTNSTIHSSGDGAGIVWLDGALSGGTEGSVILGYDGSGANNLRFGGNGWVNDGEVVFSSFGTTDVWRHMTITRSSGTTWKFYLGGTLVTTRSETMTVGSSWMLGNYGRVNGNGNSNNHYFRGRFDEIAVWHRTLTDTEISTVYTAQNGGTALL